MMKPKPITIKFNTQFVDPILLGIKTQTCRKLKKKYLKLKSGDCLNLTDINGDSIRNAITDYISIIVYKSEATMAYDEIRDEKYLKSDFIKREGFMTLYEAGEFFAKYKSPNGRYVCIKWRNQD